MLTIFRAFRRRTFPPAGALPTSPPGLQWGIGRRGGTDFSARIPALPIIEIVLLPGLCMRSSKIRKWGMSSAPLVAASAPDYHLLRWGARPEGYCAGVCISLGVLVVRLHLMRLGLDYVAHKQINLGLQSA